jgi:hypothetical protein
VLDENLMGAVLEQHLQAVEAPDELWQRVRFAKTPRHSRPPVRKFAWALAAAVVVLVALIGSNRYRDSQELHSSSGTEIRAWVQRQCGLDIPLTDHALSSVRLLGANVITTEPPTVVVKYRVGDHVATLVVARDSSGVRTHHVSSPRSWAMNGHLYTVASAGDLQAACLLCHAGLEHLTVLN